MKQKLLSEVLRSEILCLHTILYPVKIIKIRRNKKMAAHKFSALTQKGLLILIMIVWITTPGEVRGGTLYKCIDKDGNVIITDNPLPEFQSVPGQSRELMEEQRLQLEKKEIEIETDVYQRITEDTKKDKQEKIMAARVDLAKAKQNEETYRFNMEKTIDLSQKLIWREMLDKQKKVVEEKQKMLNELQSEP
jgi:hypothetical protein